MSSSSSSSDFSPNISDLLSSRLKQVQYNFYDFYSIKDDKVLVESIISILQNHRYKDFEVDFRNCSNSFNYLINKGASYLAVASLNSVVIAIVFINKNQNPTSNKYQVFEIRGVFTRTPIDSIKDDSNQSSRYDKKSDPLIADITPLLIKSLKELEHHTLLKLISSLHAQVKQTGNPIQLEKQYQSLFIDRDDLQKVGFMTENIPTDARTPIKRFFLNIE